MFVIYVLRSKQVKAPPPPQKKQKQKQKQKTKRKIRMSYLQDEGIEKRRQQEFLTTYRNA